LIGLNDITEPRQFWLTNENYRNQFRQMLSSQLLGMLFSPRDIWWVSPWITDFDLLDNKTGNWNTVEPRWGLRYVRLSELAIRLMESGSRIRMVTIEDERTFKFVEQLRQAFPDNTTFQHVIRDELHIKGMLTTDFWLKGSMNFTYRGTNKNDEQLDLIVSPAAIVHARLEYESTYGHFNHE
jgi:hypothetical protein